MAARTGTSGGGGRLHLRVIGQRRAAQLSAWSVGRQSESTVTSAIVSPMCAYTLFLFAIWALLGYVRISGGLRGTIPAQYLRVGEGPLPPAKIVDWS